MIDDDTVQARFKNVMDAGTGTSSAQIEISLVCAIAN